MPHSVCVMAGRDPQYEVKVLKQGVFPCSLKESVAAVQAEQNWASCCVGKNLFCHSAASNHLQAWLASGVYPPTYGYSTGISWPKYFHVTAPIAGCLKICPWDSSLSISAFRGLKHRSFKKNLRSHCENTLTRKHSFGNKILLEVSVKSPKSVQLPVSLWSRLHYIKA